MGCRHRMLNNTYIKPDNFISHRRHSLSRSEMLPRTFQPRHNCRFRLLSQPTARSLFPGPGRVLFWIDINIY